MNVARGVQVVRGQHAAKSCVRCNCPVQARSSGQLARTSICIRSQAQCRIEGASARLASPISTNVAFSTTPKCMRSSCCLATSRTTAMRGVPPCRASAAEPAQPVESSSSALFDFAHLCLTMGLLFALDKYIKTLFLANHITFPAPLAGMFGILAVLLLVGDKFASYLLMFFKPALVWIARWLPLFYVAPLVTLPLALMGMSGTDIGKIVAILTVGMAGTCLFTGYSAVWIRNAVKTEMIPVPPEPPGAPYGAKDFLLWGAVAAVSLIGTYINPAEWGMKLMLPFQLAVTVGGLLVGCLIPKAYHGVLHPVLVCSVIANGLSYFHASLLGMDYSQSMKAYLTKGMGQMGGGDVLMGFLGLVIMSFGFRIYMQRDTMKRHAPEILGATLLSSLFSLFSTAFMAKAMCLSSDIARALIPRSVTVALAIPIAIGLDAPVSITAAAVLLQGILGANFAPDLMIKARIDDTIARGLSAAATAGGLGTASLVSRQPEALPFCALSYSMVGILSTLIMAVPQVRALLISIVG